MATPRTMRGGLMRAFASIIAAALVAAPAAFAESRYEMAEVINGSPSATQWPWMASLSPAGSEPARGHFCGAVLIDSRRLVTAAHCIADYVEYPDTLQVVLGRSALASQGGEIHGVQGIIVHPEYDPEIFSNDLAIIKLSEPTGYMPIELITADQAHLLVSGGQSTLIGWGETDPNLPIRPAQLQEAQIPLVDDAQCEARIGLDFKPASMLCAGVLSSSPQNSDGIDSCYGDSGGPLMVQIGGAWKLAGITSWGYACASDKTWGVYSRISTAASWLSSAKIVPPFSVSLPQVSGTPRVGGRLTCDVGEWGGDGYSEAKIEWSDVETGPVRGGSKKTYVLKKGDIGRTLVCSVTVKNEGGEATIDSDVVGPIFPSVTSRRARITGSRLAKDAAVFCAKNRCELLVNFRVPVDSVRLMSASGPAKCGRNASCGAWFEGKRVTTTAWRVPLKQSRFSGQYYLRAVTRALAATEVFRLN